MTPNLLPAESFLSATLAKVVACSIAYPHEVSSLYWARFYVFSSFTVQNVRFSIITTYLLSKGEEFKILTAPHLQVIRTRMRETPCSSHSLISYQSFWPSYFSILKYEGVTGLYRGGQDVLSSCFVLPYCILLGYAAHLARVLPNSAVVFITYEAIVHCFNS
jgi:hypothetical protein